MKSACAVSSAIDGSIFTAHIQSLNAPLIANDGCILQIGANPSIAPKK